MNNFLRDLFAGNPGSAVYSDTWVIAVIAMCAILIAGSFGVRMWRKKLTNAITKKLSRTWGASLLWFGVVGLVLIVSRVERIQILAMPFLWVLWGIALLLFIALQVRMFRARHYEILPRVSQADPREKYLPGKKK